MDCDEDEKEGGVDRGPDEKHMKLMMTRTMRIGGQMWKR